MVGLLLTSTASADDTIYSYVGANGAISFSNVERKGHVYHPGESHVVRARYAPVNVARYDEYIHQAATLYEIPEELVRAVIRVESGFDPHAISRTNACGLMQLMPETAERMLVTDVFDPRQNIFGGVRYLRVLANLFDGDVQLTLAGYNAGENAVIAYGGIPPYGETRQYVVNVLKYYRYYREAGKSRS